MNKNNYLIGELTASTCFYLPTPPAIIDDWHYHSSDAIAQLIDANGNHWRKIFTIMAKISVTDKQWKHYRDTQLLKHNESICIGATKLTPGATLHIVCGQQSAHALSLSEQQFNPVDPTTTYISRHLNQAIYLCPYLDYRQFPNLQIDKLRARLNLPALS
ncbi:DUF6942 family protein [Shewanella sp. 0m-4]